MQNGEKMLIGDDRTLYAAWEPKEYNVTLEYCENWKYPAKDLRGNEVSEIRVIYGETIPDLPEPSRYGYDFLGWSSGYVYDPEHDAINGKKDAKTFTRGSAWETAGNAVLYAVWEPVSVIVEYDYNYDYTTDIPIIWED